VRKNAVRALAVIGVFAAVLLPAVPALAAGAAPQLGRVIDSLRDWMAGLLAGLATLYLTVGGLLYMTAGGDVTKVERARTALRSAGIGYALAALAPVLVAVLRSVVGA
jgi:Type IV secretion system pilin